MSASLVRMVNICPSCRAVLVDVINARIRKMIAVGKAEGEDALAGEEAACFHLIELRGIIEGVPTTGVYDDFGLPPTIKGPLFDGATS